MPEYTIQVNGQAFQVSADPDTPLLWILRDNLQLTGTKYGCGKSLCGSCTIHINGTPARACGLTVSALGDGQVTTIEGLGAAELHVVQKAWMAEDVPQCGFCQSGQIMSAAALLENNPDPSDAEIENAMSGNICRCGTYVRIRRAIRRAANELAK
ncbi:MAG: (2Fe-2S)-binding protein [Saprospiraceae bacterium]|nr:(2Fe-2S)-binding protein [Saprospiraceae bacterium]